MGAQDYCGHTLKTKCRAIKYWLKFCEPEHQNKLSGIAFTDQIGQDKKELWPGGGTPI